MRKVYLDISEINCAVGVIIPDAVVIPAGTTITYMPIEDKNEEYDKYADEYDIHFIFEDDIPNLPFFTVPQVDILARDSEGGFVATIGQTSDLESHAPICYINSNQESFLIANNGEEFLKIKDLWKENLEPYEAITFYKSKSEAERDIEFIDLAKFFN